MRLFEENEKLIKELEEEISIIRQLKVEELEEELLNQKIYEGSNKLQLFVYNIQILNQNIINKHVELYTYIFVL